MIFELGWFYGRLGRGRVCILSKKGTRIHSDLAGISYIEFDNLVDEKIQEIDRELISGGMLEQGEIDINELPSESLDLASILAKLEGKRIKARGHGHDDQYWVAQGQIRYLHQGAASICDEATIDYEKIDPHVMELLLKSRGSDLDASQMRAVLMRRESKAPPQ